MEKQAPAIPRHRFPAAVYSSGVHWPHPVVCHPSICTKRTRKSSGIGAFEICDFLSVFFMYHFSTDLGSVLHQTRVDTAASAHLCVAEKILLIFYLSCYPSIFSIYQCLLWSHITHSLVPLRCVLWGQVLLLFFGLDETLRSPNGNFCVSYPCYLCRRIRIATSGQFSSR